jgi:DHA1 family tetracycline resistance protein-like MFS transporter
MQKARPAAPRSAAFIFVFITVLLDMLALGIVVPVLPKLVVDFLAGDTARAAEIYGIFATAWALMQFLFSPLHGALSDRFGRRPLILISNFGLGLDYVLMALSPNLWWLFAGRVISGICAANLATSYAYIADVTAPELRSARFGMLGVAFGAGFVLGPALGGLAGNLDPRLPFWIAAGLSLANALYGLLVLPESLPVERHAPIAWRRANPLGALALLRSKPQLLGLAGVNFLGNLAHASLPSISVLYMMHRYGWDERAVGFTLATVGVCAMVVQGALIGRVVARFGERTALLAGLAFGTAGFATFGIAATGVGFLVGIPLLALWGLASPASLGLMSRRVDGTEQGRLQGANASVMGIANLLGPGLFAQTLALSIVGPDGAQPWYLPGTAFLLAALMLLAALALAGWATRSAAAGASEIAGP